MSQCREIRIKSVHNMYYGRFYHFTYENTLKNRDILMVFIQMVPVPLVTNCIILYMYLLDRVMVNPQYICSFITHSILPSSSHPYPFPSLSLIISPISLSIHFHFPHFPLFLNPFPTFPTLAAHSVYPLSHSLILSIHLTITYNPHTPTLHPLPHVSPHPPTHALLTTLYALVSIFSRSLALPPITHPCMFHVKHNDNNSYFHFPILYIIYHIILYTHPLHHW